MMAPKRLSSASARIQRAGQWTARVVVVLTAWAGERLEDAAMWAVNLVRDLPLRVGRLLVTGWGLACDLLSLLPGTVWALARQGPGAALDWARARVGRSGRRLGTLALQALDLVGLPEAFTFCWHLVTRASPLTGPEIAAVAGALGPAALRYQDVRVAEGGILRLIFRLNGGRAFTTFHTVNLPASGYAARSSLDILLHELVHVYQHERVGSLYLAQCLHAQATAGYSYGGPEGLAAALAAGKHYRDFNREQQAQIVQDYYLLLRHGLDVSAYEPFIAEMRAGKF